MGRVFIVDGVNFANSPLGKVTLAVDNNERAERIVSQYLAKVSSASIYRTELKAMVLAFLDFDIYDGLYGVYPLFGETETQLCTNLLGNKDIVVDTAITALGTNCITRTTAVAQNLACGYDWSASRVTLEDPISSVGATAFVRMNKVKTSGGVTVGIIDANANTQNSTKIGSYGDKVAVYLYGGARQELDQFGEGYQTLGMHLKDGNKIDVYTNTGVQEISGNSVFDVYHLTYALGAYATKQEANYTGNHQAASGDINFYLFGYVPDEKMSKLKQIVDNFISAKES